MPFPNSLAERLKGWILLRDRMKPILADVPHLQADFAAFETELATLISLDQQQESITARLRDTTKLRGQSDVRVNKLRNRLAPGLQAHLGPDSELLLEFGITPRKRRRRRKKEEQPKMPTDSAAVEVKA